MEKLLTALMNGLRECGTEVWFGITYKKDHIVLQTVVHRTGSRWRELWYACRQPKWWVRLSVPAQEEVSGKYPGCSDYSVARMCSRLARLMHDARSEPGRLFERIMTYEELYSAS